MVRKLLFSTYWSWKRLWTFCCFTITCMCYHIHNIPFFLIFITLHHSYFRFNFYSEFPPFPISFNFLKPLLYVYEFDEHIMKWRFDVIHVTTNTILYKLILMWSGGFSQVILTQLSEPKFFSFDMTRRTPRLNLWFQCTRSPKIHQEIETCVWITPKVRDVDPSPRLRRSSCCI